MQQGHQNKKRNFLQDSRMKNRPLPRCVSRNPEPVRIILLFAHGQYWTRRRMNGSSTARRFLSRVGINPSTNMKNLEKALLSCGRQLIHQQVAEAYVPSLSKVGRLV